MHAFPCGVRGSAWLSLGQVRDVCEQIRAWRESGSLEHLAKAAYWSRRLRGDRRMCSVVGCSSSPLPDRPWCDDHRVTMDAPPSRPEWWGDALDMIRRDPKITDVEIGTVVGRSSSQVGTVRVSEGIAPSLYRRIGYQRIGDIPRAARGRVRQGVPL